MATPEQQSASAPAYGQPPNIIINNMSSASASAVASAGGYGLRRRRQSFWTHFWLFMFTAGLGNVVYAAYINKWNRDRGL